MNENIIEETLKKYISSDNAVFVFPTQIAADLWADRSIFVTDVSAVPTEKFIAWDRFKGEAVRGENQDKISVPAVMRTIFAKSLIEENSRNPFLKTIIPQKYAETSSNFANWLGSLLSGLGLWKEYALKNGTVLDDEDKDLQEIYNRYSAFLNKYGLFDPAWERPPFKKNGNHYFLFFPEILSDWEEYKPILESSSDFITVISVPETFPQGTVSLFNNSRIELKNVASRIYRAKYENNIEWSDIAVSVPDMESYGAYLERELDLLEIPYVKKIARPLTKTAAGNFFTEISACLKEDFSFNSIKALLLNQELPWKSELNLNELIEFGQKNHCICNFEYNGRKIDVWKESFKDWPDLLTQNFYDSLKKRISAFEKAKTFREIQEAYFAFTTTFFDMEKCSKRTDDILGRCISELGSLIDLEKQFSECLISSPFYFFADYLSSKEYLSQLDYNGVFILPYQTACAAPFAFHVVVDSSQKSLGVIYRELSFLSDEKRLRLLKREETNVSDKFIHLYIMNSMLLPACFTCGIKTFSGYSQAVSYLNEEDFTAQTSSEILFPHNPYTKETEWFLGDVSDSSFPSSITETQKTGFTNWLNLQPENSSVSKNAAYIVSNLNYSPEQRPLISQTQLKTFYSCPQKWLLEKKLKISEKNNAAVLIDSFASGNFYHKIMELYCNRLKENSLPITWDSDSKNYPFLEQCVKEAILFKKDSSYSCYMTKELLQTTMETTMEKITNSVHAFSKIFNGCIVIETETPYSEKCDDSLLSGRIDCLLQDKENGQYFLVDFKSNNIKGPFAVDEENNPSVDSSGEKIPLEKQGIIDFQMPIYVRLLEKNKNIKIENAGFFIINKAECIPVFGKELYGRCEKDRTEALNCDDFMATIEKTNEYLANFIQRIKLGDYKTDEDVQNFKVCALCDFNPICRKTFNVGKI